MTLLIEVINFRTEIDHFGTYHTNLYKKQSQLMALKR